MTTTTTSTTTGTSTLYSAFSLMDIDFLLVLSKLLTAVGLIGVLIFNCNNFRFVL